LIKDQLCFNQRKIFRLYILKDKMKKIFLISLLLLPFLVTAQTVNLKYGSENKTVSGNKISSLESAALQKRLARGWNTWNTRSILSQVLLPEYFAINFQLYNAKSDSTLKDALIGRRGAGVENVIPGPHSYDGSYTELTVDWKGIKVNVKTAARGKNLAVVITPLESSKQDMLLIKPGLIWNGEGSMVISKNRFEFKSKNKKLNFYLKTESKPSFDDSVIACPLNGKIIISSYKLKTVNEIESLVSSAGKRLVTNKEKYGADSSLYDAMQTVLAWDVIYEPTQHIVISPVSRIWNCNWNGWVLFDWDTYFAAYMYSFDNKDLAYANVIAISKDISKNGFIPNFASALGTSEDRSEPPVGSYIVWKIYEKCKEKWFLSEVFNELLTWNRWWNNNRQVDGYLCWGSDPYKSDMPEWLTKEVGKIQAAKWESGLDNSPMYDNARFDTSKHRLMLADVGLISMYIWDCRNLSKIAGVLGKQKIKTELNNRAEKYSAKLRTLYDKKLGIYLNKNLVTGKFSYQLSPTLFYPLLTGIPTQKQAEIMMEKHFYNPKEFWGKWIIPSISRNDSAFKDNDYWRGRIWAPMNFLVYCGLKNYKLPLARHDLVKKSEQLLMKSWLGERHIFENYNSVTGAGGDVVNSDKFYHWGALLAFMKLLKL